MVNAILARGRHYVIVEVEDQVVDEAHNQAGNETHDQVRNEPHDQVGRGCVPYGNGTLTTLSGT